MKGKHHALFTASDGNCGEFLINHWFASLEANVDLRDIDVHVIDYGLSDEQRRLLESKDVAVHASELSGKIVNTRFHGMAAVLGNSAYDQAVMLDAGDVIFQRDISHLFEENQSEFRAACEDVDTRMLHYISSADDFEPGAWIEMLRFLEGKPMINASGIFAPAQKLIEVWHAFRQAAVSLDSFGSDQTFINWYLRKNGFVPLPSKYNFSLQTTTERFFIREGVFHDAGGEVIPVVHNTGQRLVRNFGYGPGHNVSVRRFRRRWSRLGFALHKVLMRRG